MGKGSGPRFGGGQRRARLCSALGIDRDETTEPERIEVTTMRPRTLALAGFLALAGVLATGGTNEVKAQGFGFYPPQGRGFNLSIGVGNAGYPGFGYGAPGFGRPGFGGGFPGYGYGPRPLPRPIYDPYCAPGYGYSYYQKSYGYGYGRPFPY